MWVGIDPGQAGGIAIIHSDLSVDVYPYSSDKLIEICKDTLIGASNIHVAVEKVHAMPHQGVTSMFTFGQGYGKILGILEAFGIGYELVTPQKWKGFFEIRADKQTSIRKAKFLFPDVDLRRTSRCRTDSDGLAEALLIADYVRLRDKEKEY